jgi:hypothetical protein
MLQNKFKSFYKMSPIIIHINPNIVNIKMFNIVHHRQENFFKI